ncbi:type I restriction enzyme HsdR N-terminal domain-containing protein [Nitratireductor luteus]|uniref:type I restriction enzyme HsdR N-terminal domain-containing protein n=1 Tax=Nitratireductor luteus TaxID=2976980 RepID=UPI002240E21C|nr:type I restriction enzyme HsdR N-terminal domain-containing protein [Nitratireductor luteus]
MTIITPQILEAVSSYNEAEVRFHVIDPMLRKLGYPGGEDVYLKLEEKLEYPYFFTGHKNKKKDLPLGFPDYRAGLKGRRGSFIIEAKAATVGLAEKDVEQAHSYAAHSQVGANYFVLSDGAQVVVYETLAGGRATPIVLLEIDELDARFHELENVLSPANLERICRVNYDKGLKLCDGLGSSIKIHSGEYDMKDWAYRIVIGGQDCTEILKRSVPQFSELDGQLAMMQRDFELRVGGGVVEREPDGRIVANVSFAGVTKNSLAAMKLLGIDRMAFATNAQFISTSPDDPTVFESTADFALEKGTMMPPLFGDAVPMDIDVDGDIFVTTRMHKEGDVILGEYSAVADYRFDVPMVGRTNLELDLIGTFVLRLIT